ncbi:hypothetical protein [Parvularcula sp. LCG005]|uniref:hypothetical protein n=1 Tax=Parvularcula sp. LCG005 TaxID=3078805 RepID=UPI0029432FE6|nr:hypothetical protein [Parvularcula sp. LCG005]WOI52186.1 hypothetical protein RUI03_08470 [Parvularcula sp. LCG005]
MASIKKAMMLGVLSMPLSQSALAATLVASTGGTYSVQSDSLFFGVASSELGGAGMYVVDFRNPGGTVLAKAQAAVTSAAVETLFTDLSISWVDGRFNNTLVQVAGVDTLMTEFSDGFQFQRLVFGWSDSVPGTAFGFDVETMAVPVPIPGAIPLFLVGIASVALARRRIGLQGSVRSVSATV